MPEIAVSCAVMPGTWAQTDFAPVPGCAPAGAVSSRTQSKRTARRECTVNSIMRGTMKDQTSISIGESLLADDKVYKAEYQGSGTFVISKPKRKKIKARQSELKNPRRGSRKEGGGRPGSPPRGV